MEVDLNAMNPQTNDYVLSSLPFNEQLYGYNDLTSSFNSIPKKVNTFTPLPIHVE